MLRVSACALVCGLAVLASGLQGQEAKKDDPKAVKKDEPKAKEEPKAKGLLPPNWGKIGLTDDQKQSVYRVQSKYADEIEKLDAKIKQLRTARDKEMFDVLTADQKKALEAIFKAKAGTGK